MIYYTKKNKLLAVAYSQEKVTTELVAASGRKNINVTVGLNGWILERQISRCPDKLKSLQAPDRIIIAYVRRKLAHGWRNEER